MFYAVMNGSFIGADHDFEQNLYHRITSYVVANNSAYSISDNIYAAFDDIIGIAGLC